MIKMFINDEEVVSNKELSIKEEMLATPSTILNNCYPKSWENIKDYVSKFYYPRDYSRCIIAKGFERGEDRWLTYNESGSNINFDTNISLPFKNITIDGKSTQATSTNPVSPSPDYPSEIECVKNTIQVKDIEKNIFDKNKIARTNGASKTTLDTGIRATITSAGQYKFIGIKLGGSELLGKTITYSRTITPSGENRGQIILFFGNENSIAIQQIGGSTASGVNSIYIPNKFPDNTNSIYVLLYANSNGTGNVGDYVDYTNLMFVIGSSIGEYEPYQENTLNINLQGNELCSLPNNVKDELVIENGRAKIIKNVGKYNITGNEAWALSGTESQPYINFGNYVDNCKYPATSTELPNLLSNYYLQITRNNLYDGRITLSPGKALIIYDTVHNTSLANFKTWLKSAGVVVYYQLATPTEIDLGEVTTLSTFEGVNNVSLEANIQTNMSLTYLYKNYELIFCGIVKNSGNISLNPRYPHFCDLQILDFKNFLSESDMLDFVISNKTVVEAINMVIEAIKDYGFILGNVNIFGADDIIKAYSTQNKTAYDVFQYLADITGSRWYTRTIDEETVAIDFYDPTLMPSGMNIEYNVDWFEENQIVDLQFNYGSRDYRNKQVMMSNEVFGNINYNETLISNGYETSYLLLNNIGEIVSITINGEEKTFVTNELHDIGFEADFYYTPNKNQLESEDTYSIGTQIVVKYIPIIEGRQVVYNYDEIMRINNQTGRKGIIARYETRNDTTSSKELEKIGETYIKYKGTSEINLLLTSEKDLYNIGQIVYFDSPINELTQSYMVKTKEIKIIAVADFQKVLYNYELTSSFNSEKEINYFDNQRSKNKGNIEEGETITRNIDIENSTEILFNNLSISEVTPTGDNILDCILESPFID